MNKVFEYLIVGVLSSIVTVLVLGWAFGAGRESVRKDCESIGKFRDRDVVLVCGVVKP